VAFREPAPTALARDLDEPVGLEGTEMVVHLLPWHPRPLRQHGGGGRPAELREELAPYRVQGHRGGGGVFDHMDMNMDE